MSDPARPWWASDGPVDGGIDPNEDPVERLRAARRGVDGHGAGDRPRSEEAATGGGSEEAATAGDSEDAATAGGEEPWRQALSDVLDRLAEAADQPADDEVGEHGIDVCGVCPVCIGLRSLAESRPELLGHLTEAARHLTLAARSLLECADRDAEQPDAARSPRRGASERLQRIDLE